MRLLEPIVARFVDQIVALLRTATLEELAELFAYGDRAPAVPEAAPRGAPPRRRRQQAHRRPAPASRETSPLEPPPQEVTDPSALLAAVAASEARGLGAVRLEPPREPSDSQSAPPPPAPAPPARPVLREGEAVVRTTGAGVVLRRRRPADPGVGGIPAAPFAGAKLG
jgi:hypothetical protein